MWSGRARNGNDVGLHPARPRSELGSTTGWMISPVRLMVNLYLGIPCDDRMRSEEWVREAG